MPAALDQFLTSQSSTVALRSKHTRALTFEFFFFGDADATINQGDATVKIETQEQELRGLRTRVRELEMLLVEQQDTLDRLIADAMGEVGIVSFFSIGRAAGHSGPPPRRWHGRGGYCFC